MKNANCTYTVRVSKDAHESFFSIKRSQVKLVMAQKPAERYGKFAKLAKPIKLHADQTDLHLDASGNQSDEDFWARDLDALDWMKLAKSD